MPSQREREKPRVLLIFRCNLGDGAVSTSCDLWVIPLPVYKITHEHAMPHDMLSDPFATSSKGP